MCLQISVHFTLVVCFFFCGSPKEYSQVFSSSEEVAKKQGKTRFFLGCLMSVFLSISSPHGHLSSSYTLLFANVPFILLLLCYPSLRWSCFLVSIHFYLCCVLYFSFSCLSWLSSLLVWQKSRSNHKYLKFWFSCSASGLASPHFHLAQIVTLLGPEKNPSKWYFLPCFLLY